MKNFWRNLAINMLTRLLSGVFIYLTAKGYITSAQGEVVTLVVATILVNLALTLATNLLARWHVDLARLTEGLSRTELAEAAGTVGVMTKLVEAATPGPNQAAFVAAVDARDTKEPL